MANDHRLGFDANNAHPPEQRAGLYPVLLLGTEIPHDRYRITSRRIVRHGSEAQIGDRRPELRAGHERHKRVAATGGAVLENFAIESNEFSRIALAIARATALRRLCCHWCCAEYRSHQARDA